MSFHEQIEWVAASVIAVGSEASVRFLDPVSGALVKVLSLDDDQFGHFGDAPADVLYVLGWCHVFAVDRDLEIRWVSRNVAIDGVTWRGQEGDRILLSAEMDPPGGWEDVAIDAVTGRRL